VNRENPVIDLLLPSPSIGRGIGGEGNTMTTNSFDSLESCVRHWRQHWGVPGIVVGIYRDGDVSLHAEGIGHLEAEWPMRVENLFRIASITKVFTATAAMMLVEEGKLDLDEPVKTYVPDLSLADPEAEASITMRHLLTHLSGLYGDFFDDFGADDDSLAREVAHLHTLRQLTKPGELWHYCNSGFDLAGHVIATIAGVTYEDFIRERIFEPLGMERSGFFAHEMIAWPHAVGNDPVEPLAAEHKVADQHYPRNYNPSGAVVTNVEELFRFAAMHMNDGAFDGEQIISGRSARAMREVQTVWGDHAECWGIGWSIREFPGKMLYGHGGSTCGFQSQLTIAPDRNFALCIWTNSGRGSLAISPIEEWILERELGLVEPDPEIVDRPGEDLQRLAGRYMSPRGEIKVDVQDGSLRLAMTSVDPESDTKTELPEAVARPVSRDRFIVLEGPFKGEVINFFPHGVETPTFLRRHARASAKPRGRSAGSTRR
jgi:CubicO group peptidase (beta-lactamase class C family)